MRIQAQALAAEQRQLLDRVQTGQRPANETPARASDELAALAQVSDYADTRGRLTDLDRGLRIDERTSAIARTADDGLRAVASALEEASAVTDDDTNFAAALQRADEAASGTTFDGQPLLTGDAVDEAIPPFDARSQALDQNEDGASLASASPAERPQALDRAATEIADQRSELTRVRDEAIERIDVGLRRLDGNAPPDQDQAQAAAATASAAIATDPTSALLAQGNQDPTTVLGLLG